MPTFDQELYNRYLQATAQGYQGSFAQFSEAQSGYGNNAGTTSDPTAYLTQTNTTPTNANSNHLVNWGSWTNVPPTTTTSTTPTTTTPVINTGANSDNSTVNAPWGPSQQYIIDLMQRAQTASNNIPGVSQNMSNAYSGMQGTLNNNLTNQAQGVIGSTLGMNPNNYFGAGYTNSGSAAPGSVSTATNQFLGINNPYLTQAIDNASQDAMRNMTGMFNQQNRASGSFGNSGLAEYQSRTAADTLGNIATNARMGDYNSQMNLAQQDVNNRNQMGQFNATNLMANNQFNANLANQTQALRNQQYNTGFNNVNNAAFNSPGFNTANMGNYGQLYNTASNMNNAQWAPLQNYGALLGNGFGTTQTQNTSTNPWLTGLGALGIGSSIYSNIFGGG